MFKSVVWVLGEGMMVSVANCTQFYQHYCGGNDNDNVAKDDLAERCSSQGVLVPQEHLTRTFYRGHRSAPKTLRSFQSSFHLLSVKQLPPH